MRSRDEIKEEMELSNFATQRVLRRNQEIMVEVLLDIRELIGERLDE